MATTEDKKFPPPVILTVGGSDSTGGAGVQGDLRTIDRMGGYGVCVITAVTAQDTDGVRSSECVAASLVAEQLLALGEDLEIAAVKAGMLGSYGAVDALVRFLDDHPALPLVLDPVLAASDGFPLLDEKGVQAVVGDLFSRVTLVTPNRPEVERLTGCTVADEDDLRQAARVLVEMGAAAALITGGHGPGETVLDLLYDGHSFYEYHGRRIEGAVHGTGCALAAGIATGLAHQLSLVEAVARARDHLIERLAHAYALGRGQQILP